jgi:hypothetical protein
VTYAYYGDNNRHGQPRSWDSGKLHQADLMRRMPTLIVARVRRSSHYAQVRHHQSYGDSGRLTLNSNLDHSGALTRSFYLDLPYRYRATQDSSVVGSRGKD